MEGKGGGGGRRMGPNLEGNSAIGIVSEGPSAGQVWHSRFKTGTKRMQQWGGGQAWGEGGGDGEGDACLPGWLLC